MKLEGAEAPACSPTKQTRGTGRRRLEELIAFPDDKPLTSELNGSL